MTPTVDPEAKLTAEQRADLRRRVMKGGKITYGDFVFARDCSVRDVSPAGARVSVPGAHEIPDEFYLIVSSDRLMYRAQVRWRRGGEIGVSFEGKPHSLIDERDPRLRQFTF